jgi:hypothetical protein
MQRSFLADTGSHLKDFACISVVAVVIKMDNSRVTQNSMNPPGRAVFISYRRHKRRDSTRSNRGMLLFIPSPTTLCP